MHTLTLIAEIVVDLFALQGLRLDEQRSDTHPSVRQIAARRQRRQENLVTTQRKIRKLNFKIFQKGIPR